MADVKQERLGDMTTSPSHMELLQYSAEPTRWVDGFGGHHPLRLYDKEEQLKKETGGQSEVLFCLRTGSIGICLFSALDRM